MGTIAQKLTYLDGTKQALKESINNLGGDITSETTFREYAQELDNIYDNLPKTTGEDTNLSLTTLKGKMNIQVKGNTSQDGTPTPSTPIDISVVTGTQEVKVENVNLLDISQENINIGGANSTIAYDNEGYMTITNNNSSASYINIPIASDIVDIGSPYTLKVEWGTSELTYIYLQNSNDDYSKYVYTTTTTTTTNTPVSNFLKVLILVNANKTIKVRVQVQKGNTISGDYTPHQEQTQIVSLGDIELCKIGNYQDYLYKTSGKNKFDKTNYEQGYSYTNGSKVANTNWGIYYLSCNANETYTISGLKAYSGAQIVQLDNSKNIISVLQTRTTANTFTITSTQVGYIGISFVWSTTPSLGSELDTIMINLGSTALPYEPYGSGKWYKKENVAKINCKNTDTWYKSSSTAVDKFYMRTPYPYYQPIIYDNIGNKCNYFTYKLGTSDVGKFNLGDNSGYLSIFFNYSTYGTTTLNDFKTWIGTIDLTCYLPLQVANDIQITNTNLVQQLENLAKLYSYNGTTNITSTSDTGCDIILSVSALKGA